MRSDDLQLLRCNSVTTPQHVKHIAACNQTEMFRSLTMGDFQAAMHDPTQAVNIAFGPPFADLTPQDPNTGIRLGGQYEQAPKRLIFKKAHLSREDFRVFDQVSGRLVCVSHHHGKNPYQSLDPLGSGHNPAVGYGSLGEMESLCHVTGTTSTPVRTQVPYTSASCCIKASAASGRQSSSSAQRKGSPSLPRYSALG
jgi:hypothetical protein